MSVLDMDSHICYTISDKEEKHYIYLYTSVNLSPMILTCVLFFYKIKV